MPNETITESPFALTRKVFEPIETQFTPGERSMVAWISTDCVDHERDVVVSAGVDYKTYFLGKSPEEGNPCVLAFHDLGRWPLGRCEWVKIKQSREFNGLYAKTLFDDDPETEAVWRKIKSGSLRGISIGFRPPDDLKPGEWGPPTREELLRRPDWNGAERIIRRCILLEYSICSLPMNPRALVAAVNKGVHRPVFSSPQEAPEAPLADDPVASLEHPDKAVPQLDSKSVADTTDVVEEPTTSPTPHSPASNSETEPAVSHSRTLHAPVPCKPFDHVRIKAPHYEGVGRIESLHARGHVPHVAEDMIGTPDDPAACIRCYKPMGDGYLPTHDHVAVRVNDLEVLDEPMRPPSKIRPESKTGALRLDFPIDEPLPQIIVKSDQEVRAELITKLNQMLSPDGFRRIAREEAERAAGFV